MKDVLVLSYEGNVRVENAPQNASECKIIEVARKALQDIGDKAISRLNNVVYLTPNKMYKYISEMEDRGINVREDYLVVEYYNYK